MTKIIVLFAIVLGISLASCNPNGIPKGFPEKNEFAKILADVHYAEAMVTQQRMLDRGIDTTVNHFYHFALARHNLTQQKFDTIVSWYVAHPELYQLVYDQVIAILTEQGTENERELKILEGAKELARKEKLARNVWKGQDKYLINAKDTFDRRIPFIVEVDTIDAQGYTFSAFYLFLKDSKVKEAFVEIVSMYADSTKDTLSYMIPIALPNPKVDFGIGFDTDKKIIRMEGFLLKHDTLEQIRARINSIEFEFRPLSDSLLTDSLATTAKEK